MHSAKLCLNVDIIVVGQHDGNFLLWDTAAASDRIFLSYWYCVRMAERNCLPDIGLCSYNQRAITKPIIHYEDGIGFEGSAARFGRVIELIGYGCVTNADLMTKLLVSPRHPKQLYQCNVENSVFLFLLFILPSQLLVRTPSLLLAAGC
jgi:hypothetical protein